MKKIRVLIVEDEPIIAADLEDRLTEMGFEIVGQSASGEQALLLFEKGNLDLVLMDIQLEGALDGIQTAQKMLAKQPLPIIYLTSNADDATFNRAKNTLPAAFLTKPFRGKDLQHAIELAISRGTPTQQPTTSNDEKSDTYLFNDRLFIKVKDRMLRLFLNEILWLEADDYYCKLVTREKEFLITQTLKQMGESLSGIPEFLRVHRSYIVNLSHVEEIGDLFVLIHKKQIPLNKSSKEELTVRLKKI
ncbi:MAG: response regulator [Saprospiraceae bacterium]|nr:response regulator [Saprospiraceae bacterium]